MRIWKYELKEIDEQIIRMPAAKPLTVQMQHGKLCMWCMVDESCVMTERTVRIYGTGHPIKNADGIYVGTFQMHNGALVFHVFIT